MMRPLRFSRDLSLRLSLRRAVCILSLSFSALPGALSGHGSPQKLLSTPGMVREFSAPLDEVRQAVTSVQQDHTIHGTKMFDKDPALAGADAIDSTPLFE